MSIDAKSGKLLILPNTWKNLGTEVPIALDTILKIQA